MSFVWLSTTSCKDRNYRSVRNLNEGVSFHPCNKPNTKKDEFLILVGGGMSESRHFGLDLLKKKKKKKERNYVGIRYTI